VDEVSGCVAIRRAQPVVFDSSESINSCPKLRGRPYGPCSAACVPVSVAGRPVGVLHAVAADRQPPPERLVGQLATLSTQLGNRLGALRALESSRLEAATDKLTGLPNRRLLESQLASLIERSTPFVLVLADLDNFKRLNDSFGHEIGDRALQLFAQVLRDKVRGNDVIARLGGEEFVLVYPNMSVTTSIEAVERVRDGLTQALAMSTVPEFTCSFGITHSSVGRSADSILRVADAGLLRAKELGRDQVVYADETLAARIFGDGGDDPRR
jgi:diguanylate cyclase (GGDEF)-like protein